MLSYIDERLRDIKGARHKPFGGANLLTCGDLSQLSPVKDCWVFQSAGTVPVSSFINVPDDVNEEITERQIGSRKKYGAFDYNIWKDSCVSYELFEIMRTENKEFARLQIIPTKHFLNRSASLKATINNLP